MAFSYLTPGNVSFENPNYLEDLNNGVPGQTFLVTATFILSAMECNEGHDRRFEPKTVLYKLHVYQLHCSNSYRAV